MNISQKFLTLLKKPVTIILGLLLIVAVLLAVLFSHLFMRSPGQAVTSATAVPATHRPTPSAVVTHTPVLTAGLLPIQGPASIMGIEGYPDTAYPGIPWIRIPYPTCGSSKLSGEPLKSAVQAYHRQGIRVLLTLCQPSNLNDTKLLNDAAQGQADAVQCGNEEMKQDAAVAFLYVQPVDFAKFYDRCASAMHAVRADLPVLLGSLDPHVANDDYQQLVNQVGYLNQMQEAMNTSVHPGGDWNWHNQTLGLIDSWHNGYLGANNLSGLFAFWAQQFHLDLNSGQLGKHLWVVEGTGCFKGCGVDENSPAQEAIAHILTLITDVQTSQQYQVPLFYFSGKDFFDQGINWPIGILDGNGHPKPLRQDLAMGARTITFVCSTGKVTVSDQEQLLAKLYSHCTLPSNYLSTLTS